MNGKDTKLNQSTLWEVIKKHANDSLSDSIGRWQGNPTMLIRDIEEGNICPTTVSASQETVWLPSVPRWEHWCRDVVNLNSKPVDFFFAQKNRLERRNIEVEEISELIQFEHDESFQCDIKEVHGIAASKSAEIPYKTIKEFAERGCSKFLADGFDKNIEWSEIRLHNMQFHYKEWASQNYYWVNSGGSHHFAAAWMNAHNEENQRDFTLSGPLTKMTVNKSALSSLAYKWDMYIMDRTTTFCEFLDAMNSFKCSFGVCPVPRGIFSSCFIQGLDENIQGYETEEKLAIIILFKGDEKQNAVSKVLTGNGFASFTPYLLDMTK